MQQQMATSDIDMNSFQNANLNTESTETQSPRRFTSFFFFFFQRKTFKKANDRENNAAI